MTRARLRKLSIDLAVLLVSTAVAIGIAVVALQFTQFRYVCHGPYGFPRGYFVADPVTGFDLAKDFKGGYHEFRGPTEWVYTNSLGCYDRELGAEPYILVVGDSGAWGFAPSGKRWTDLLEKQLGIRLLKCGVPGVGTRFELEKAGRVIAAAGRPPRAILVLYISYDLNDDVLFPGTDVVAGYRVETLKSLDTRTGRIEWHDRAEIERRYAEEIKPRLEAPGWGCAASILGFAGNLARTWVAKLGGAQGPPPVITDRYQMLLWNFPQPQPSWFRAAVEAHKRNLTELAALAHDQGAALILVDGSQIMRGQPLMADMRKALDDPPDRYLVELPKFPRDRSWLLDGHWNETGNAEAAALIGEQLRRAEFRIDGARR